jgi:hypothetical protein
MIEMVEEWGTIITEVGPAVLNMAKKLGTLKDSKMVFCLPFFFSRPVCDL